MPEPITITAAALGIGSWFGTWAAGKLFDFAWQTFKDSQVVERAIDKTNQTFTAPDHRWSSGSIRPYLENWTQSPRFKGSLRKFSEEGQVDEDQLVEQFLEVTNYPEDAERRSARKIVCEFLQHLDDELNNTYEGARLGKRIKREHAKRKQEHEEILGGVNKLQESAEEQQASIEELRREIREKRDILPEPAREAVNNYLEELENWKSPQGLIEQDLIREAVEIYEQRLKKIRGLQNEYPKVEPLFRNRKQYLLLKSATLYSQLGEEAEADKNYELAKADGFSSPKHRQLALTVLMNLQRPEEYRQVMEEGEVANEEAEINLLLLEERWAELAQALPDEPQEFRHAHLRVVTELSRDHLTLSPAELSRHLDQAESLADNRRIQKAQLAMMTVDLLSRVVNEMLEAPELDRSELVASAHSRTERALSEYDNGEADVGLYPLLQKARQLYHLLADEQKREEIENRYNEVTDGLNSRDERDRALSKGQITQAHHLFLQAVDLLDNPAGSQEEGAISLLESALHLAEEQELRLAIAKRLINLHLQREDTSKVESILDRLDGVPDHRLVLLRLPVVREQKGIQDAINYLSVKADEYPRHLYLRRVLVRLMTSRIEDVVDDPIGREEVNSLISRIRERGKELQRILPTDQHMVLVARGLFAARHYNGVVKLLDEIVEAEKQPPVEAMQIRAQALLRLERLDTAAEQFAKLAERSEDWGYAVNASAYWMQDNEPEKAISLLESWIESHPDRPQLKVNLAAALIEARSEDQKAGRRAFNLLAAACKHDQVDGSRLYMAMHRAASIAGKEAVARRYFQRALPDPSVTVRSTEDMQEVWSTGKEGMVGFQVQGKEGMQALVEWNREYTDNLNKLYGAELVSYGNLFRQSGRMMQTWTHWTDAARKHHRSFPGQTAIKAPWPTVTRRLKEKRGLLLDVTALLTIWKLSEAEALLNTMYVQGMNPHIRADDLALLRRASSDYAESMFGVEKPPYEELVRTLGDCGLLQHYEQEEVEQLRQTVPEHLHEHLMASTPDVGLVYELQGAVYISDQQESIVSDYEVISKEIEIMTSADLLGALVGRGLIGEDEAREAQKQDERFQGWRKKTDLDLPEHVVISGFAVVDWYETGLLTTFQGAWLEGEGGWPELHLGPFGSHHLREQDQQTRTKKQKEKETTTLYKELRDLIEEGIVTVLPVNSSSPEDEGNLHVTELATYGTKLIQVADQHGLNVWSDDRMIGYLLWDFGHPLPVPEIKEEFREFRRSHPDVHLTTTEELLERLNDEEAIDAQNAEELGYELVKLGYRPLHFRLALAHLLRNYAYHSGSPRYEPLLKAVASVLDGPQQRSSTENGIPGIDPAPLQRLMLASMLPELIVSVWQFSGSRSLEERKALADDIIELGVERLHAQQEFPKDAVASFWVSILAGIAQVGDPNHKETEDTLSESEHNLERAIDWFTQALSDHETVSRQVEVVRQIEDYLADYLRSQVLPAINNKVECEGWERSEKEAAVAGAISSMSPFLSALLQSHLLEFVDPVFRRAMGVLSQTKGMYRATLTSTENDVAVNEEEIDHFATGVVADALHGSQKARSMIRGDLAVECIWERPVPEDEKADNPDLPESTEVYVDVSFLTLLLRKEAPPELFDVVSQQLHLLDPSLQKDIQDLRSEEDDTAIIRRSDLAVSILRSPFFELQRDLTHGIKRMQKMETERYVDYLSPQSQQEGNPPHPRIELRGDRECPSAMISEFRILYAESGMLYAGAEQEAEAVRSEFEDDSELTVEQVATAFVPVIENLSSPLEMASTLLAFLIMAERIEGFKEAQVNDSGPTIRDWIDSFIRTVLRDPNSGHKEPQQRRTPDYKSVHAAAIRLGANVAGTANHLSHWREEFDSEEEVTRQWIHASLMMAARLIPMVEGKYRTPQDAKDVLEETVRDLGIAYDQPLLIADRFNPFLLGPHLLDHEVAATLYVLSAYVQYSEDPASVVDLQEMRNHAERWASHDAGKAEEIYREQKEKSTDVLDLKMPFLPSEAASHLIEALDTLD